MENLHSKRLGFAEDSQATGVQQSPSKDSGMITHWSLQIKMSQEHNRSCCRYEMPDIGGNGNDERACSMHVSSSDKNQTLFI